MTPSLRSPRQRHQDTHSRFHLPLVVRRLLNLHLKKPTVVTLSSSKPCCMQAIPSPKVPQSESDYRPLIFFTSYFSSTPHIEILLFLNKKIKSGCLRSLKVPLSDYCTLISFTSSFSSHRFSHFSSTKKSAPSRHFFPLPL